MNEIDRIFCMKHQKETDKPGKCFVCNCKFDRYLDDGEKTQKLYYASYSHTPNSEVRKYLIFAKCRHCDNADFTVLYKIIQEDITQEDMLDSLDYFYKYRFTDLEPNDVITVNKDETLHKKE